MSTGRRAGSLVLDLCGVRVRISCDDAAILRQLRAALPARVLGARAARMQRAYSIENARGRWRLLVDGRLQARTRSREGLLGLLESDLTAYVAEQAPRRVFVHAGVVGWGGRAVVIPGRSQSGKSTLVAELVRAGARYYSDEFAVVDSRGLVYPFPTRLALRGGPGRQRLTAEDLGGRAGRRSLPVGLVLVTHYRPGARWRPRRLSAGHATLALLANTVPARSRPADALRTLARAVQGAESLHGVRGEAGGMIAVVSRAFSGRVAVEARASSGRGREG